ncbi:MAG: hypothetical protein ABI718_02810 [Acidobacteriota bacterium]
MPGHNGEESVSSVEIEVTRSGSAYHALAGYEEAPPDSQPTGFWGASTSIGTTPSRSNREYVDQWLQDPRFPWEDLVGQLYLGSET